MDYSKMTCKELVLLCKEKGVKGYSRKKKAELVDLLSSTTTITSPVSVPQIEAKSDISVKPHVKVISMPKSSVQDQESAMLKAARREKVLKSYSSAEADNHERFLSKDDKATEKYIFPNQIEDANNIVDKFYKNNRRVISIQKKTKVGADGLMIEIAKLLTSHIDDDFILNPANVRIITGMSNAGWEKDMKDKSPTCFKDKIFHHGKLSRSDLTNLRDGLIIIDEIDTGDKECQVLHITLKEAGVLDVKHMERHNIRFVFISATMIKELFHLYPWGELHECYKMTIPKNYIGHKDFLDMGIVQEFYPLTTKDNAEKWIQEDILTNYGTDYRVHIVRVNKKCINEVQNACICKGVVFRNHTSTDRLSEDEIKEFFKDPLTQHIVLGVKGFFRRANLIPNRWKLRIGATHELCTNYDKVDYNVQIQGLTGRMTGYWRSVIEGGHKTGPHRTSIKAIEQYEIIYNDPFGINSYQSSGFKKKEGKVVSKPTMLSANNIKNLEAVNLPEVDEHTEYDITELYEDYVTLNTYLKSIIKIGKLIKYTIRENNIQYRGITTPLYVYKDNKQFKKMDIYGGINKIANADKIVCRIMPVMHNGSVKWIGIYLKTALQNKPSVSY